LTGARRSGLWIAAALLLAACSPHKTDADAAASSQPPLSEDIPLAFQAAFGAAVPAAKEIARDGKTIDLEYSPAHITQLKDGRIVLTSTGVSPDGCSLCGRAVAVHYLQHDGAGYRVTGAWYDLGPSPSQGDPPTAQFREDLFDQTAVEVDTPDRKQGCETITANLYELTPGGPVLRGKDIPTQTINIAMGALRVGPQVDDYGDILAGAKGRDFHVRYRGTQEGEVRYLATAGVWAPQPGFRAPGCAP
jgi:hypothetical protein